MLPRSENWQKIWKFFTNPTVDVILVIAVFLLSAWIVIETDAERRKTPFPVHVPIGRP